MKKSIIGALLLILLGGISACGSVSADANEPLNTINTEVVQVSHSSPGDSQIPISSVPPISRSFRNVDEFLVWSATDNDWDVWDDLLNILKSQDSLISVTSVRDEITLRSIKVWPNFNFIRYFFLNTHNGDRIFIDIHLTDKPLERFISDFELEHQRYVTHTTQAKLNLGESLDEFSTENGFNKITNKSDISFYYDQNLNDDSSQIHSYTMAFFAIGNEIVTISMDRLSYDASRNISWDNEYLDLFEFNVRPLNTGS